ncbi:MULTISPECIES: peptide deformylase [unclassified Acinetobacter]|uniref:peptide deformylase n=1 Tax=unclassified Acinetobacter TaxID=196816 RepID=UPI0015D44FFB|nr:MULTISPECIES: peptide deformylase [unclassified Acinetobacter]UUS65935.1 peptide deformylase [Acinetobacter sp. YH12068_T]
MSYVAAVAQRGEAILKLTAAEVQASEIGSEWLIALSKTLHATMLERQGVGIAAPQIYVSKRVIIVASRANLRYPDAPEMEAIVMVNPVITSRSTMTVLGEEGCLIVPNGRGQVPRAEQIHVRYLTLQGEVKEKTLNGFPARIVQHEVDHLNGILFTERLE